MDPNFKLPYSTRGKNGEEFKYRELNPNDLKHMFRKLNSEEYEKARQSYEKAKKEKTSPRRLYTGPSAASSCALPEWFSQTSTLEQTVETDVKDQTTPQPVQSLSCQYF